MKTLKNYAGLEYVTIQSASKSIPIKSLLDVERKIAKRIILERPLRGKELLFLRKQLELSCAKLSVSMNGSFDASTLSRWEKHAEKRLAPENEMYIRIFFSEQLGVKLEANSRTLIPEEPSGGVNLTT